MRSYPRNSPEAAARLVALVLIADGHVCRSEVDALQQLQIERELGLAPGAFAPLVHTLCEDLLLGAYAGAAMTAQVDEPTLASLLAEVDDTGLQRQVLRLAEAWVMDAARSRWGVVPGVVPGGAVLAGTVPAPARA